MSIPARNVGERLVELAENVPGIPERLLLAHSRGEVIFVAGAGVSLDSGMPDFRDLVLQVYETLDPATHAIMRRIPRTAHNQYHVNLSSLNPRQAAEVRRFVSNDYDVVLGLLERRLDEDASRNTSVRERVCAILRDGSRRPAPIHKALIKLADRGGATTLLTTNFDRLFELAARQAKFQVRSYSLGAIPRPGRALDFAGVLHVHGSVQTARHPVPDLILSDRDFGEFYLRRRIVPDLIYDLARLFHIVLVGYSANDPPMRYLLNAVAADGTRFRDLKERFTFIGSSAADPIAIEDWKGRGITPITYDAAADHSALVRALTAWAELSAINGSRTRLDREIRELVSVPRATSLQPLRDRFDHLYRRSSPDERIRIAAFASRCGANVDWLTAIAEIDFERGSSS